VKWYYVTFIVYGISLYVCWLGFGFFYLCNMGNLQF
jgi:hypothetical protein